MSFKGWLPWRLYNSKQDLHANYIAAHSLCSQVRLLYEMAFESLEVTIFSVDSKALLRCEPDSPSVSEKNMVKEFLPSGRASKPKHDGKWVGGTQL